MIVNKIFAYYLDFALSNEYFKVILRYLELEIFNEKVHVLFVFFYVFLLIERTLIVF